MGYMQIRLHLFKTLFKFSAVEAIITGVIRTLSISPQCLYVHITPIRVVLKIAIFTFSGSTLCHVKYLFTQPNKLYFNLPTSNLYHLKTSFYINFIFRVSKLPETGQFENIAYNPEFNCHAIRT